jgi:hypothetical protein
LAWLYTKKVVLPGTVDGCVTRGTRRIKYTVGFLREFSLFGQGSENLLRGRLWNSPFQIRRHVDRTKGAIHL